MIYEQGIYITKNGIYKREQGPKPPSQNQNKSKKNIQQYYNRNGTASKP
jgi:hypothetical protein